MKKSSFIIFILFFGLIVACTNIDGENKENNNSNVETKIKNSNINKEDKTDDNYISENKKNEKKNAGEHFEKIDNNRKIERKEIIKRKEIEFNINSELKKIEIIEFYNTDNHLYSLELSIEDYAIDYYFNSNRLNSVKDLEIIDLPNGEKALFIKIYDRESYTNVDEEHLSEYYYDIGAVIFNINNKIEKIFDTTEMIPNNYKISYIGEGYVFFEDLTTKVSAKFNAITDSSKNEVFLKRLENIEAHDIPESMAIRNLYNIKINISNLDGSLECICSKYIPSVYRDYVLGIIKYTYQYTEDGFVMVKQSLEYDKDLEMPPVEEIYFNKED